jgi:two-component system, NarL family, response regulator
MVSERARTRVTRTTPESGLIRKIRLLIADDHPVVREGLGALVKSQPDMTVVSEAVDGRQAVQQFLLHRPDVALMDLRMPEMNGIEALHAILEKEPKARIIMLSTYGGDEDIRSALKAGAKAYILKDSPRDQLLESIRAVYQGQLSIPPEIGAQLAASMIDKKLTDREREILSAVVAGKSNKEIGSLLGITEGTVKVHIGRVFKKLGAAGRTEAVRIALRRGFVHLSDFSSR